MWIAVVATALASNGCGDECTGTDSFCDGEVSHTCVPGRGTNYWNVTDCAEQGRLCVAYDVDGGGSQCALEREPRAVCAPANTEDFACDGDKRVLCNHGYVVSSSDCGGEDLCVMEIQGCVARAGIDPTCEQLPTPISGIKAGYCDGETGLRCVEGWVTEIVDCGSKGMQCYELQPGVYPVCVASDTPDARCAGQRGVASVCSGNVSVSCANDRFVSAMTCSGVCENGFCH